MMTSDDPDGVRAPVDELKLGKGLWWVPWVVAWGIVVAAALSSEPLSGREGELLHSAANGSWRQGISPLVVLILRLAAAVGPPAEVILRLLGLTALFGAAGLGGRICLLLGGSRRAGLLAATCLISHGALLLNATRFVPSAFVWAFEALLLYQLLILRENSTNWRRLALIATATVLVSIEPLTTLFVLVLTAWVAFSRQDRRLVGSLSAVVVLGAALAVGWGRPPWVTGMTHPNLRALTQEVMALGPWEGFHETPHALIGAAAPAVAIALIGLAMTGWVRGGWPLRIVSIALILPGALSLFLPRGVPWGGSVTAHLLPAVILLAVCRTDSFARGPNGVAWFVFLFTLSGLTGLRVITNYDHFESRAAASGLEPGERVVVSNSSLERAIHFYRPMIAEEAEGVPVRIWRPGDRQPRFVAVHAFGRPLGRLWLVRPGEPLFDMQAQLGVAQVTYRERDRLIQCPWLQPRRRFFCGGPDYQHVTTSHSIFAGIDADAAYVHPLDDGVLELRWDDIALGRRLLVLAGLDDRSLNHSAATISLEVHVGDAPPIDLEVGARRGLIPFEIDTSDGPSRGSLVFRVTAENDRGRHLFVDALTTDRGAEL